MTSLSTVREAVYRRFVERWVVEDSDENEQLTRIFFENEIAPDRPSLGDEGSIEWVRLVVRSVANRQESLGAPGNRRYVRPFLVSLQIFTEVDQGMFRSDTLVESARQIFEGTTVASNIVVNNMTVSEIGPDGPYYQTNVVFNGDAYSVQ